MIGRTSILATAILISVSCEPNQSAVQYEVNVFSSYGSCFDTDLEHLINLEWELLYVRRAVTEYDFAVFEYVMKREKRYRQGDHKILAALNLSMATRNLRMYTGEGNCDEPWELRP
ncbi:MAG: hypothetical protein F4X69_15875 [Gemmatimonadetes bacterium]|nr:hypothetical protein [Gemmatimonadota bacterium]